MKQWVLGLISAVHKQGPSLIGRDRELRSIVDLLELDHVRMVTVVGTAGVGKTSLAHEALAWAAEEKHWTTHFVDLSEVRDSNRVMPEIEEALGIRLPAVAKPTGDAAPIKLAQAALLALDNFEQLLDAAPRIATLVASVDGLKLLVTSRFPVNLLWEHIVRLNSLPAPSAGRRVSIERLSQNPAVQLFVERATARDPEFRLTDKNAGAIAEIIRRLDGLPLALELAAAHTGDLSLDSIVSKLRQGQHQLGWHSPDRPSRQQTLDETLEWTFHLLLPAEQEMFLSLGVMAGTASEAAIRAVLKTDYPPSVSIIEILAAKSLVETRRNAQSREVVYCVSDLTRDFARKKLSEAGKFDAAEKAHARYFLDFAGRLNEDLAGPGQAVAFAQFEGAHDNLRSALAYYIAMRDWQAALTLANNLTQFWWHRGYRTEGRTWFAQLLASYSKVERDTEIQALLGAGTMFVFTGEVRDAQRALRKALSLARRAGDRPATAHALTVLGVTEHYLGRPDAVELFQQALAVWTHAGKDADPARVAVTYLLLGSAEMWRGESTASSRNFQRALDIFEAAGDRRNAANAQVGLALTETQLFRSGRAAHLLRSSLASSLYLNDRFLLVRILEAIVTLLNSPDSAASAQLVGARDALAEDIDPDFAVNPVTPVVVAETRARASVANVDAYREGQEAQFEEVVSTASALLEEFEATGGSAPPEHQASLNPREIEVLGLIAQGRSPHEIAIQLNLSERSVRRHVASIEEKLHATNRAHAVAIAVGLGIIQTDPAITS